MASDAGRHSAPGRPPERRDRRGGAGRRLGRRVVQGPKTVEAYLRANSPPRYMQRLREIDVEYRAQLRRLEDAYRALADACAEDGGDFARLWMARARAWRFDDLNELVREHNEWYPAEFNLPMDPRTRDYVRIHGRSYRPLQLGPDWVLEHFPAGAPAGAELPRPPARAPREPL